MKFSYEALGKDGKKQSGTIDAVSEIAAGHLLKDQGLIPTELKSQGSGKSLGSVFESFRGVKLAEKIVFIQDLSLMLKAGISVSRALKILSKQTQNKRFTKVLEQLTHDVENGMSLHESMEKFPRIFSQIFSSMIKIGEMGGNLDQSLQYLSVQLEREADLKAHVRGAMIYPSVIVGAMVIIGIIMSIYVLPKLTSVFKEFGADLPFMTKLLMNFSDFMAANSLFVMGGLVVLVFAVSYSLRTKPGKYALDVGLVYAPILNPIVKKINLARFARIMSSLLKSGIPIVEGLKVSGESIPHVMYRDAILEAGENVKVGKTLTDTLSKYERIFPFIITQMIQIGEETGNIETILEQLATHYEAEVDLTLKNFSSIIEPMLLLVIGTVVGFVAYALVIPIYNIGSAIQ